MSISGYSRRAIGMSLIAFLIAVYFVTYSGYAVSRDEWFLFDATESMARRGTLEQNFEFDAYPPVSISEVNPPAADTEPMQPILATPLFWIAQALPGIGLVHTVWLFNILVTALTAGTLYAYGLALGYRVHVAVLVALIFGLGTIAWPYSRTFFREPLFTWLGLLSAYLIMRVRQEFTAGHRPVFMLILLALVLAGALLSKEVTLLLLPAFLIEAMPARWRRLHLRRRDLVILVIFAAFMTLLGVIALNADTLFGLSNRYAFSQRVAAVRENLSDSMIGIKGYLFSPSRSMWIFSPVLLLGFAGWPRLIRQRRWRELLVPLVVIVFFVVGYSVVRGPQRWSGGLGWGARYLVPVTPFVALWLLPVIAAVLEKRAAWWQRPGVGIVFLFSAGIQIAAALVNLQAYYDQLTAEGISSHDGMWTLRWSQIPVTLGLLGSAPIDLAWKYAVGRAWLLPVFCALLAGIALGWALWWARRPGAAPRSLLITAGSLAVFAALTLGGGLYVIRHDPRYAGNFQPTHDLLNALEKQVKPDDVIVLNDFTYSEFFMNYYKLRQPTIYTLPVSPGERYSPEQAPKTESPNPEALIHLSDTIILENFAQHHTRLWLVINSSSFIPWSVRPVEHYLARHYFPVTEINPSDLARAVLFDMTPAPSPTAQSWPAHAVSATFGDSLRLVGYDIPGGQTCSPGEILPVSLLWEAVAPIPQDYTVVLFIMSPDGTLIAQRDSYPVNAFDPTQSWRTGSLHRDNHGLQLPANLPPGEYELWAAVYWWQEPDQRLPVTGPNGKSLGDYAVLTTITIRG